MIILDNTGRRLRVLLGGAGTIPFFCSYKSIAVLDPSIISEGSTVGATNGATPVDLAPTPPVNYIRKVETVEIRNNSGGGLTVIIRYDDNGTSRDIGSYALDDGDMLGYEDNDGWEVLDSTGKLKVLTGTGGGGAVNFSAGTTSNNLASVVFSNSNGVSFGLNGSTITGSIATSLSNIRVSAGTTSNLLSAITFADSNGLAFGINASTITGSYTVPTVPAQFSGGFSTQGNTLGDTGIVTGRLVLVGTNNITLSGSTNAGSITISISGGAGGAGNTGSISAGTTRATLGEVVFSNSNGVSFGVNGQTITGSIATSLTNINISAGTTSNNLSAVTFSNSNNVSFGLNGSTITATATVASTQGSINLSAGTTSNLASAFTFSNANNVSFGLNASTITASISTSLTNIRVSAGTTSNLLSAITFADSNGISFGLNASTLTATVKTDYLTSQSNQNVTAGNGGFAFQTLSFSNVNGISFGTSAGSAITGSHNAITSQSNQQMTLFATSNTTQSSTGTTNASSLIFAGAGAASVGITNGSIVISAPNAGAGNVTFSAGTSSAGLASIVFSNSNGVSFGLNGSTITASAAGGGGIGGGVSTFGNTAGSTGTVTTGNIVFVGSGVVSLSQSTGAAGSNATISILAPATSSLVGANGIGVSTNGSTITVSQLYQSYFAKDQNMAGTVTMTMLQSTSGMFPLVLPFPLSIGFMRLIESGSVLAASSTAATTGNSQFSGGHTRSHNIVIYSRGIGASSMSLQSVTSTQVTEQYSINVSAAANSTQFSYSLRYTFPCSTGTTVAFTKDYSSSAASLNFHTSHVTDLTGLKVIDLPFPISLAPGQYWLGYGISSSTASQFNAGVTRAGIAFTHFGISQMNSALGTLGAATNSSVNILPGLGSYSVAGGGTSASINLTQLSSSASQNVLYFQFMRIT